METAAINPFKNKSMASQGRTGDIIIEASYVSGHMRIALFACFMTTHHYIDTRAIASANPCSDQIFAY